MIRKFLDDGHPAALFTTFTEGPCFLKCAFDVDLVECDPNTITSTPAFFNTVTQVVIRL